MQIALTTDQTRSAERTAVDAGVPLAELMDRAGTALARQVEALVPSGRVLVLAGPGNNGGDGWVAARSLAAAGRDVTLVTVVEPGRLPDPARAAARAGAESGSFAIVALADMLSLERLLAGSAVVVDALLGVGLHGPLRDPYPALIAIVADAGVPVVAADVPTGIDSDTGALLPMALPADVTVTFGAPKRGLLQYPAAEMAGALSVADIGLDLLGIPGAVEVWAAEDLAAVVPGTAPDADKSSRGRLLVVAGSVGMSGAAVLAASAAQRAGAGYVTLAVPEPLTAIADAGATSAVTVPLPDGGAGCLTPLAVDRVLELASRADAVVLGPGIGRREETARAVRRLVAAVPVPLLLDADGLYAIAGVADALAGREAPTVITPHPGEAGRLLGVGPDVVQRDRYATARRLAALGAVAVLKGARTVIDSGARTSVNMTGGPELATSGTGDVLSGVIGALLARGVDPYEAASLGVYLHGRAGDLAAASVGPTGVVAGDLPLAVARALMELLGARDTAVDVR